MPAGPEIAGEQIQERNDRRIFMFGVGTVHDNLSIFTEFKRHLGADFDPSA